VNPSVYDPEFESAVRRGTLSQQAASRRGSRAKMVERLVASEGLSLDLAMKVADNEIGIADARRISSARPRAAVLPAIPAPVRTGDAAPSRRGLWIAAGVVLALLATGYLLTRDDGLSRGTDPSPAAGPVTPLVTGAIPGRESADRPQGDASASDVARVEEQRDAQGQLTQLAGPTPQAVLEAFAAKWPGDAGPIEIEGISEGAFLRGDMCQGVYWVGTGEQRARYGFALRFDAGRQVWLAGNGSGPIRNYVVP